MMADDLGFSCISPCGGEIRTPNLQRLADEGLRHLVAEWRAYISQSFSKGTGFFRAGDAAIESDTTSRGSGIATGTANLL